MKIIKYKKLSNNKYKIILDSEELILYDDVIVKNSILLKKNLTREEIDKLINDNIFYEGYYKAIAYIKIRMRSIKEISDYLRKYISENLIDEIIDILKSQGYLNDDDFARCFINDSINLKMIGPNKIIYELEKLGINENIINKNIKLFTKNIEEEKIKKIIEKQLKINKSKSVYNLKNSLRINLINNGFNKESIDKYVNDINYDESSIYEKEYNKLYNKLSKKYSGYELEQRIKQKLFQKGLYKNQ